MNSTNTPVALSANTAPFEERANDEITWTRKRIVARATEIRDELARLVERLADPNEQPTPSDGYLFRGARPTSLSTAARMSRWARERRRRRAALATQNSAPRNMLGRSVGQTAISATPERRAGESTLPVQSSLSTAVATT
jgi:hypothetical protein